MKTETPLLLASFLWCAGCGETGGWHQASDDPADWSVEPGIYDPVAGEPRFVVPADNLPLEVQCQAANNNVDIIFHQGRLFLAWRSAPNHFASAEVQMWVVSSPDNGATWDFEALVDLDTDVREPRFLSIGGELQLMFFEAGTDPLKFEPRALRRSFRRGPGEWSGAEEWQLPGEDRPVVPWDVKVRRGQAWLTGYAGEHYSGEGGGLDVLYYRSADGRCWQPVQRAAPVYHGGISEVAFEFAADGTLWAVGRNEDGDATGFGSQLFWAENGGQESWRHLVSSDPERYDSPELFRHGQDIYLAGRRDVGGPFGADGDLAAYSLRPKRSALYRIDTRNYSIQHLFDVPGVGDTSFFAARRTGRHTFLLANYTSPLDEPDVSWLTGQTSARGTQIYLMEIELVPER